MARKRPHLTGVGAAVVLAFVVITSLDIILGELAPKAIGLHYNERIALLTVGPMRAFMWLFGPFIAVLEAGGTAVAKLAGAGEATTHQAPLGGKRFGKDRFHRRSIPSTKPVLYCAQIADR